MLAFVGLQTFVLSGLGGQSLLEAPQRFHYRLRRAYEQGVVEVAHSCLTALQSRRALLKVSIMAAEKTKVLKGSPRGTAKEGRPWRGSVKIEPGFFQVF